MNLVARRIGLWICAALVGFLLVEAGYRVRLVTQNPLLMPSFASNEPDIAQLSIVVHTHSFWKFSETEGFELLSMKDNYRAVISGGRITGCRLQTQLNKYNAPGLSEGSYEDAEIKLAVFGNSFSMNIDEEGMTWVNHLQRKLTERLNKSVYVMNFARDGQGLMQMLDIAASKVPSYKPDLAIVAFVTNRSPRYWRTETAINGEPRVLSMLSPTPAPTSIPPGAFDTFLVHPGITREWCETHKDGGALDQIGREIVDKYLRSRPKPQRHETALSLTYSFLWNRVVHRNPFYNYVRDAEELVKSEPQLSASDYANDARLTANIKVLQDARIPYLVVHLPMLPEVQAQQEYSDPAVAEIAKAVSAKNGKPVYGLLDYMKLPVANAETMTVSDTDIHPSRYGMTLYSDAVVNLIFKLGVLPPPKREP